MKRKPSKKKVQLLEDFLELGEKCNIKIIHDKGDFNGDNCLLFSNDTIVINKHKPLEQRLYVLAKCFSQINLENVHLLERAWEIRTGVPGTFKGTPIQVGDGLYLCTGQNIILSLDPDNGEERWRFDPQIDTPQIGFWDTCRGVTHYEAPNFRSLGVCEERIFTATTDARLIAVNKATGERCDDFGDGVRLLLLLLILL